jgi:hypothetical protein
MVSIKRRHLHKRNTGKVLAILVAACMMVTACGGKKEPVSVSISVDAPFKLQPGPLEYQTSVDDAWFKHTLTVENTSDRPISISRDISAPQYIGDDKLLVLEDQCAPNLPAPDGNSPGGIVCTSIGHIPADVEPHASAELSTFHVYKGLEGMSALTPGKYTADFSVIWRFTDESETHTDIAKITYRVK